MTRHCLKDGVLLRVITNNTLQISPPFVVDADDLRRIAAAIAGALDTLAELKEKRRASGLPCGPCELLRR